jgi:hypothetical protein
MQMKKSLLLLMALIIFCSYPLMLWGQEKAEVPELKVGDFWKYQISSGNLKSEVKEINEEGYVIAFEGSNISNIYDPKTLNLNFIISGNKKNKADSPWRKILDFPLFVGKKWDDSTEFLFKGKSLSANINYQVEALEDVKTSVGTFKSFRIFAKAFYPHDRKEYWMKLWYSPEVKFWIKRELDRNYKGLMEDAVLVEYKLKER